MGTHAFFPVSKRSRRHNRENWTQGSHWRHDDRPRYYKKRDDDEYVIIDFEGNNVPREQTNSIANILRFLSEEPYTEDGFKLTADASDGATVPPTGFVLADLSYATPSYPELSEAITKANQKPGRVVGLAAESESELVIQRENGDDFEFKGGYFAFAPVRGFSDNTNAAIKLTFEGYKNGALVDSFESMIPASGYIKSGIDEDIDKLVIKDNDLNGWTVVDNLKLEI